MRELLFVLLSADPSHVSGDPFHGFRAGFANVILGIFGLVLMVALTVTIIHVIQGERESAKKMLKWIAVAVVGAVLIGVVKGL